MTDLRSPAEQTAAAVRRARVFAIAGAATIVVSSLVMMVSSPVARGGEPELTVLRPQGARLTPVPSGATVGAGEVLTLRYSAGTRTFAALIAVDGRKRVTVLLPEGAGDSAARIERGEHQLEVDGFERFHLLISNEPFSIAAAVEAASHAEDGDPLELPSSIAQRMVTVRRAPR